MAVRVTPDALRQIRGGSPWVYDGSITSTSHEGAAGDLAVVFDTDRAFAAIGLWDPTSPIRLRVLHHGRPVGVDDAFWAERLATAAARRTDLAADGSTTGYRLVHGENDGLPGLIVDRYDQTLVVKLYTVAWLAHLAAVVRALVDLTGPERIVLRFSRAVAGGATHGLRDGDTVLGTAPTDPMRFLERGLVLEADVVNGQKTGHFLDQRDNRALIGSMAAGAEVLDVFASTGGFSLAAAAGGARLVHLVDQSAPALATARRNLAHNDALAAVGDCEVQTTVGDAFEVLADLATAGRRFDIVVLDPPSFAGNAAGVPRALAAYERLAGLGLQVVRPGGVVLQASCSSRVSADDLADTMRRAAATQGARVKERQRTGHAVDHPIGFQYGGYLKAIVFDVPTPG